FFLIYSFVLKQYQLLEPKLSFLIIACKKIVIKPLFPWWSYHFDSFVCINSESFRSERREDLFGRLPDVQNERS
ncbi:MAG: hypothetical protein NTY91_04615, partial [Euryarchaeota archaeon]|nr:hypothetical protein [Euryarchaeota archaeon]